jgi:hypothetical protein
MPSPVALGNTHSAMEGHEKLPSCFKGEKKITSIGESVERIQRDAFRT